MSDTYAKESRKGWYNGQRDKPTDEQLQLGCLQRIADATEKMCLDREKLERELKDLKWLYRSARDRADRAERSNAALRGVVTRLKRHVAELKGQNHAP